MNARRYTIANLLATGVIVTILLLTGLFWLRTLNGTMRHNLLSEAAPEVKVRLSALLPWEQTNEPNRIVSPSAMTVRTPPGAPLLAGLGIVKYVESRVPTGPGSYIYRWDGKSGEESLYYDPALGQMVYSGIKKVTNPDGTRSLIPFAHYAGPQGVGSAPDETLGRFVDPIVDRFRLHPWILYDRGPGRFFSIDWTNKLVKQGPELPDDHRYLPVQIGVIEKNIQALTVQHRMGSSHDNSDSRRNADDSEARSRPHVIVGSIPITKNRIPVLDASGRIDWLDAGTLELSRGDVHLRAPASLYSGGWVARPQDIAAYSAVSISVHPGRGKGTWDYAGTAVAALARDATSVRLDVFDPNGQIVAAGDTEVPQYVEGSDGLISRRSPMPSPDAAYFRLPGAQGLTLAKLTIESLHPPVLLLLSYLRAGAFEATAGYRSLFLLPDSFVAMKARDKTGRPVEEFFVSMVFMIPALILALLLAWRVDRDAGGLGLSKNERAAWVAGTVVLGLPAYITYRLTRPKATLVTCTNCGLGRRPDLEKCHRCGSPWVVPELTPPAWRVLDAGSPAAFGWETPSTQPGAAVLQDRPDEQG